MRRIILCLTPALLLIFSLSAAWATLMAEVTYLETDMSGSWRYEFTVKNTSDPVSDAGFGIFDVQLDLGLVPGISLISSALPNDWDFFWGPGDINSPGFIEIYSLLPGLPPVGADIVPDGFLGGFVFQFDARLNAIQFDTFIAKLAYGDDGEVLFDDDGLPIFEKDPEFFKGSATSSNVTAIPEPSAFALVAFGLAGMGLYTRRKESIRSKNSTF